MAKFSCCSLDFATEEELARRQGKAHGKQKRVLGTHCGQEFYTEAGLREHMRVARGKAS